MELTPLTSVRSTLMFVGVILTGCALFAVLADSFTPQGVEAASVVEPLSGEDVPVIPYVASPEEEAASWYAEDAAPNEPTFNDEPIAEDPGSIDDFADTGSSDAGSWNESASTQRQGTIATGERIE